jgi:hypothetical protein
MVEKSGEFLSNLLSYWDGLLIFVSLDGFGRHGAGFYRYCAEFFNDGAEYYRW